MADPNTVCVGQGTDRIDIPWRWARRWLLTSKKNSVRGKLFWDGAASAATSRRANFAAVFKLPVIFVLETNGFIRVTRPWKTLCRH